LKLPLLFAKYLYQHKQLNLPGIGVFTIDSTASVPDVNDKNFHEFLQYIRFNQKNITKPDEELIDFIRVHTGKIRPLAESDLESFLSDGKILLNIGKPFHLQGIGTLQKSMTGSYEFHPGLPSLERLENYFPEKESKANTKQSFENDYSPAASTEGSGKTLWIVLAILVGLAAVIWGGYSLYNRNTDNDGTAATAGQQTEQSTTLTPDTVENNVADTLAKIIAPPQVARTSATSTYKFIFRTARNKNYIVKRYNDLKTSDGTLNWDTKDSVTYRLFVAIPATPADTSRIRDSLKLWYGTKKIIIEQ
jgi:hypothetical protein